MEFIHKLITKNPINDTTMGKIKDRVKQVLSVFIKNYAKKTNLVIVEQKENDYKEKEKRKSIIKKDNDKKIKYFTKMYGEEANVPNFPELPEKDASLKDKFSYCKLMLDLGFKPLFPRGKYEPLRPLELRVEVIRYVIKDPEYEPYATYIIKATKGKEVVEKERTFKVFEKLNLCLKKII